MSDDAGVAEPPQAGDMQENVRKALLAITVLTLAVAVMVAFVSVTEVIATWFEPRWVPVVRAVFAVAVAALAVWVLARLTGGRLP